MSYLNVAARLLTFDDAVASSNPKMRSVDRILQVDNVSVGKTAEYPLSLAPGEEVTVFDGTRTTSQDGTTQLAISLSALDASRYRMAWTTTGANPLFKTERTFGASGSTLTLTLNSNNTVTVTGTGPTYASVSVGDQILIPGAATGDTVGPFNADNIGYWNVIAVGASSLTLSRPSDVSFTGKTEVVAVTTTSQFIVFAPDRVQVGDSMEITAGFSTASRRSYRVVAVSPRWIDFVSTVAIAAETVLPTATGVKFYSSAKKLLYIEADQLVVLRPNGDTGETNRIDPILKNDGTLLGWMLQTTPVYKLTILNKSTSTANVLVVAV